ncbi:hypothetical protein Lser_V15G41181 [Lactuca serriola]
MDQPVHNQDQEYITIEDDEITKPDSDSESNTKVAVPSYWQSGIFRNNNQLMLRRVEKGTSEYVNVARSFINGMRSFENHVDVVAIHRKNYKWSVMDEARAEAFRRFATAVANRNGGDPNIRFGWYGGFREEIRDILCYGFRRLENSSSSYGRGVYFSPVNNSNASQKSIIADSDGAMHVLLCRLILGKLEPIPFGSQIDHPTSTEFNSGVDDLSSPKRYIIWEPYMNTFVLPLFIVTFKANSLIGVRKERWHAMMKILLTNFPKYLSSSKMAFIKKLHYDFYKKKISGETFVRNLRIIAGDDIIREIIRVHNTS